MKHIYKIYALLGVLALLLTACDDKEEIVFEHEKPQFELKEGAILLEVIVPQTTQSVDGIYITGAFNGGEEAIGQLKFKLKPSENSNYKWGVYLYESDFRNGKTLADGYTFVSELEGEERSTDNQPVVHTGSAGYGERVNVRIERWKSYFGLTDDWPEVPADKVMLRLQLPDYTPDHAVITIYGAMNDWDGSDLSKWGSKELDNKRHYILLDPEDAAGDFKVLLIMNDDFDNPWKHQANELGDGADGDTFNIGTPLKGEAYFLTIKNWMNSSELKVWPAVPSGKVMLRLELPEYTPGNAVITIYGAMNDWDGSDLTKWGSTALDRTHHYILLDPEDAAGDFKVTLIVNSNYGVWWHHQANELGDGEDGEAFNIGDPVAGEAYKLTISNWMNSSELNFWPDVPADKVMFRLELPDYTPDNAVITIYGGMNDWDGSDLSKWGTTEINHTMHYLLLDPEDAVGDFKATLILHDNYEVWWHHQANENGDSIDGDAFNVGMPAGGEICTLVVKNWMNSSEI